MKIVSFNIRCDFGQDGGQNFSFRKGGILKKISQEKPDIIGFQEVLPHISEWLRDNLSDYIVVGCGRSEDLKDESMTLALKKKLYNFWGSKFFGFRLLRIFPVQDMTSRAFVLVPVLTHG